MNITKLSDAAIGRNLIVKIGSDADHVAICGAADVPIGVTLNATTGAEQAQQVALLSGGLTMTASAAITAGATLERAANGKCATIGGGVGVHLAVGQAITAAAADGDLITVSGSFFIREI
jgi:hypothetical protein